MEISQRSHFPEFPRARMLVLCLRELGKTSGVIHYTLIQSHQIMYVPQFKRKRSGM